MAEKADELKTREDKIAQAKELYSRGSRNYLVKSYSEAADDLSQVCGLYEELYGPLCDELGMAYLLYAKSLLALEENKIIEVPDEEEEDDDDEEVESEENGANKENVDAGLSVIPEEDAEENSEEKKDSGEIKKSESVQPKHKEEIKDDKATAAEEDEKKVENGKEKTEIKGSEKTEESSKVSTAAEPEPGTSNGNVATEEDTNEEAEDGTEVATNLQVAWEILELAAKIFEKQGEPALPNLAEVKKELANIQFENNVLDAARDDYNNALKIYKELPSNYRRAMAEIHYKIGLTYLMQEQQSSKESVESLKQACELLDEEIKEVKSKPDTVEKDKANIEDLEETRQEIWVKITEIEESRQQCLAEVRAALDNYISPSKDPEIAGPSSSSSTNKPAKDISHLIKRKKPDSTTDAEASPAKRPTL